jgi:mxaJ protein
VVGDDMAATPPGHALARRGMTDNVRGVPLGGDPSSGQVLVEAVARGELDAVYVWGPQAGWFAARHGLRVTPVAPVPHLRVPVAYGIAMGVRRDDQALRDAVDEVLHRRRGDVQAILARYAVPMVDPPSVEGGR